MELKDKEHQPSIGAPPVKMVRAKGAYGYDAIGTYSSDLVARRFEVGIKFRVKLLEMLGKPIAEYEAAFFTQNWAANTRSPLQMNLYIATKALRIGFSSS